MGYLLSSLGNLPVDDDVTLYIFVVNGHWEGGPYSVLEQNFAKLAKNLGGDGIIAMGLEPAGWTEEVADKYFGQEHDKLYAALPALLITDSHPDNLTEDSLRLIIPLTSAADRLGNLHALFDALASFAHDRDPSFLERFQEPNKILTDANSIVDLKPNFLGFGININALIERFRGA